MISNKIQQLFYVRKLKSKIIALNQPSLIIPGDKISGSLWLGDQETANNKDFFRENQIQVVITVAKNIKLNYKSDITHKVIPVLDVESSNLLNYFEEINQFIDEQSIQCKNILGSNFHCHLGVSRSPTIVIAYLMFKKQLTKQQAYDLVKETRSQINPNKGFLFQLDQYEQILLIKKQKQVPKPQLPETKNHLQQRQVRVSRIQTHEENQFYQVYMKQLQYLSPQLLYSVSNSFKTKPKKLTEQFQTSKEQISFQQQNEKVSRTQRALRFVSQNTFQSTYRK